MPDTVYNWESPDKFEAKVDDVIVALVGQDASTKLFLRHIGIGTGTSGEPQDHNVKRGVKLQENDDDICPIRLLNQPGIVKNRVVLAVLPPSQKSIVEALETLSEWFKTTYWNKFPVTMKISGFVWLVDAVGKKPSTKLWSDMAFDALGRLCYNSEGAMEKTIHPVTLTFSPSNKSGGNHEEFIDKMWEDRPTDYKVERWTENSGQCPKEVFNKAIRHRTQRTMEKLDGKNEKYDKSDIIIAVMGATGRGKTNLISKMGLALCPDSNIGSSSFPAPNDTLGSGTKNLTAYRVLNHPEHQNKIVILDTPGFDDIKQSDGEILKMIATWMMNTYKSNGKTLRSIIYVNSVKDNRVSGSALRSLKMFGNLCGTHAAVNVLFISTMWDTMTRQVDVAEDRMGQYVTKYWKALIDEGASYDSFDNSIPSATKIFNIASDSERQETITRLLDELVRIKKQINETDAVGAVRESLKTEVKQLQKNHAEFEVVLEEKLKKIKALQQDLNAARQIVLTPEQEEMLRSEVEEASSLQRQTEQVDTAWRRKAQDIAEMKSTRFGFGSIVKFARDKMPGSTRPVRTLGGAGDV